MGLFSRRQNEIPQTPLQNPDTLRNLVRNLKVGVYITEVSGRIVDANPAFLEIMGVPSIQHFCAFKAGDLFLDPVERTREMEQLQRAGFVREFEVHIRRPDGQCRTLLDTAFLHRDPATGKCECHGTVIDITNRKENERDLNDKNVRDALTGCHNRRWLAEFERRMQNTGWAVVAIDVDHFKQYNDKYGHDAGDAALIEVSRTLLQNARADDYVVRMGGDEFVVLLAGCIPQETQAVGQRLRQIAAQHSVPFSVGWAAREGIESLEKTLTRADHNMYAIRGRERSKPRQPVTQ